MPVNWRNAIMMNDPERPPSERELLWPTILALRSTGGMANNQQIVSRIAEMLSLSDSVRQMLHGVGPRSEMDYRCAWARTRLKQLRLISNYAPGFWRLEPEGETIEEKMVMASDRNSNKSRPD